MNAQEQTLLGALADLVTLLETHREERWALYFRQCRDDLAVLMTSGAGRTEKAVVTARLQRAYGGIGSFLDLVILPGGVAGERAAVAAVNKTLRELAEKVYMLSFIYEEKAG